MTQTTGTKLAFNSFFLFGLDSEMLIFTCLPPTLVAWPVFHSTLVLHRLFSSATGQFV
ncbi:hypothetical protein Hanom_Chr17g01590561 [Helianthus anomalus]